MAAAARTTGVITLVAAGALGMSQVGVRVRQPDPPRPAAASGEQASPAEPTEDAGTEPGPSARGKAEPSSTISPPADSAPPAAAAATAPIPRPAAASTTNPDADVAAGEVTVQVLDGGAGDDRTAAAAARLRDLGYRVVKVDLARCCYAQTTVFFTSGNRRAAEQLRTADARFAEVEPDPGLTEPAALHVVVGEDWPAP